jgi:DNA-directed RNA polymerase subunit F
MDKNVYEVTFKFQSLSKEKMEKVVEEIKNVVKSISPCADIKEDKIHEFQS